MKVAVSIIITFYAVVTVAQDYPRNETDLSRLTDDLLAYQDSDIPYEDLYENYVQLFSNPLDLNRVSASELRMLNILSESQVESFYNHIQENGKFLSIYELQTVPGFDLQTIYRIIPFVSVGTTEAGGPLLKRILHNENSYIVARYERRLQKSKGYSTAEDEQSRFSGTPDKFYWRFRSSRVNDFSFGFTSEKDAGESIQWNPDAKAYGLDYLSYHAQLMNKKKIKNVILGDFQCQFGQGLLLGNAFGLGKGGETVSTIRKSYSGFLPYTSVNEAGYLRGLAATYQLHRDITLSAFYSRANRDASIDETEVPSFSTISVTGLHRNEKEWGQRKAVTETAVGGVLQFKHKSLEAGLACQSIQFSIPVVKDPSPYNQFAFRGDHNLNTSLFFNYTLRNLNFFGEGGKTFGGGNAAVIGALTSLHPQLDMAMLYRKYDRDFYSFYGNAFAEGTLAQNESGIYWGWKYRFNRKYTIATYIDLFKFPWLRFRTYRPSHGHEFLLRFNYTPSRKVSMFAQFRQEQKDQNAGGDSQTYAVAVALKRNLWLNCDYSLHPNLRMKTRAQFSAMDFNNEASGGMTLLQDITWSVRRFQVSARYALFDTDNFDNRQYVYENDVWLAYSLPAYFGNGIRNYIMLEYKFTRHLTVWLRYSTMHHADRTESGSGMDLIQSDKINDVKFQLRITL